MSLQSVFNTFCAFGAGQTGAAEMDNAKFAKLAKDTGILNKKLTKTDVDLIFTKSKAAGARKIGFAEFEGKAVPMLAEKRGISVEEMTAKLIGAGGPTSSGTVADQGGILDKLTDASQYTGAHKNRFDEEGHGLGAAGRVQNTAGVSDLSQITGKIGSGGGPSAPAHREATEVRVTENPLEKRKSVDKPVYREPPTTSAPAGNLKEVFTLFCAFGAGQTGAAEMDNAKFAKLAKDTKILDKKLTKTDVDLIFTKSKAAGARKIGYAEFESKAVPMLAEKKGVSVEEMTALILSNGGPTSSGTMADQGGILDKLTDTSLYTGAHKNRFDEEGHGLGAAGRVQNTAGVSDLSEITGKIGSGGGPSAPAHREVPKAGGGDAEAEAETAPAEEEAETAPAPVAAAAPKPAAPKPAAPAAAVVAGSLKDVFTTFCAFGASQGAAAEMDNAKFAKFAKDTGLLNKKLTKTDVDLIFTKSKSSGARKIGFGEFEGKAVPMLAEKRGVSVDELTSMILSHGGPSSSGTVADQGGILDKLTDASQYTGAHKNRFDEEGHGLGAAGRVQNTAGVSDLSQITGKI